MFLFLRADLSFDLLQILLIFDSITSIDKFMVGLESIAVYHAGALFIFSTQVVEHPLDLGLLLEHL